MSRPKWKKVNSNRNSECGSARLETLDWKNWWTDHSGFGYDAYLHVESLNCETVHRVYCRSAEACRVGMRDGELCWIVDRFEEKQVTK